MKKVIFTTCFLSLLLSAPSSFAIRFANQFVEFELPPKWSCALEGAEWVCQSSDKKKKRDAIIILAAKLRGEQDSLDQYQTYLKKPKKYKNIKGHPVQSEPKYAKISKINNHAWVDSLHLESEIPGFYTRYIATVKKDIGVLVTYSIHKKKYSQYLKDFENLVKTLKVFRKPGVGLNRKSKNQNLFETSQIPKELTQSTIFPGIEADPVDDSPKKKKKQDDELFYLIVVGLVLVVFIVLRRRRG